MNKVKLIEPHFVEGVGFFYRFGQVSPASDGGKMARTFAVQPTVDLSLDKHGKAFVEPKVLEIAVGHQIASPAVRNLVGNQVNQGPITGLT